MYEYLSDVGLEKEEGMTGAATGAEEADVGLEEEGMTGAATGGEEEPIESLIPATGGEEEPVEETEEKEKSEDDSPCDCPENPCDCSRPITVHVHTSSSGGPGSEAHATVMIGNQDRSYDDFMDALGIGGLDENEEEED